MWKLPPQQSAAGCSPAGKSTPQAASSTQPLGPVGELGQGEMGIEGHCEASMCAGAGHADAPA